MKRDGNPEGEGEGEEVVSFRRAEDGLGVVVDDNVEQRSLTVGTDVPPRFTSSDPDSFVAPLDDAITFYAGAIEIGDANSAVLLDENGNHLRRFGPGTANLPRGTYYLNVLGGVQVYIRLFETSLEIRGTDEGESGVIEVSLDGSARVEVGGRSRHTRPAATIRTTDDPRNVAEAVSYLGSGVKEWSVERSWPTVRGHPPAIERGERLCVPETLEKPETGVAVEVPESRAAVYRVAPLAAYLGATVEVGDGEETVLRLENGYDESLGSGRDVEAAVDDLLARCFFLDSLVRIGGYFEFDRYEYDEVAGTLPFYPPELYDVSLCEQLMEYLEVSIEDIRPCLPAWPMTATLRDDPADVGLLPYLANDLARIRVTEDGADGPAESTPVSPTAARGTSARVPPAGASAIDVDSYRRGLDTPTTEHAHVLVVGTRTGLEAAETVAAGHTENGGTVEFVDGDDRDALVSALARDVDCVLVATPVVDGAFDCRDRRLPIESVDVEATTVVLADGDAESTAQLVDAGALNAIAIGGDTAGAGRVTGYLLAAHTHADAVDAAGLDRRWWIAGDPTRTVAMEANANVRLYVGSVGVDSHRLAYDVYSQDVYPFGGVIGVHGSAMPEVTSLHRVTVESDARITTEEVVEVAQEPENHLILNGERIHDLSRVTPEFVRESARRALESDSEDSGGSGPSASGRVPEFE